MNTLHHTTTKHTAINEEEPVIINGQRTTGLYLGTAQPPEIKECCTGSPNEDGEFFEKLSSRDANIPATAHDHNDHQESLKKDLDAIVEQLTEQQIIERELAKIHEDDLRSVRYDMYTLSDLRKTSFTNDTLFEPFLPRIGIGAVVGMPDSGKSMMCRQLALTIAYGKKEFFGFPLNPKHKRAIFVTTEDTLESTKACFTRQSDNIKSMIRESYESQLRILIADDLSTDEVLARLETMLTDSPVDLIVIDAYGDVFKGGEGNSNIQNRNSLRPFSILSKNHGTCILFVHHTNKAAKYAAPDQIHVQGGSGFVQKVRTVLELRSKKSDGSVKYLVCTKGNGVSHEEKRKAIELTFDGKTFLYTPTGKRIALDDLRADRSESSARNHIDAKEVFAPYEMTLKRSEIIERVMKRYEVSEKTADRWMIETLKQAPVYGSYSNPHFSLVNASLAVIKTMS